MRNIFDKILMRGPHVCPYWMCFTFDNVVRRLFQNPAEILAPYIKPGDTVIDIGPGKGYFTIPLCHLVEKDGIVIAIDIQKKMLDTIQRRATKESIACQLKTHASQPNSFNITAAVDFVLAFWVVHEVPEQNIFFRNVKELMKPDASLLIAEPYFHVTWKAFDNTIKMAQHAGFRIVAAPKIAFSHSVVLKK